MAAGEPGGDRIGVGPARERVLRLHWQPVVVLHAAARRLGIHDAVAEPERRPVGPDRLQPADPGIPLAVVGVVVVGRGDVELPVAVVEAGAVLVGHERRRLEARPEPAIAELHEVVDPVEALDRHTLFPAPPGLPLPLGEVVAIAGDSRRVDASLQAEEPPAVVPRVEGREIHRLLADHDAIDEVERGEQFLLERLPVAVAPCAGEHDLHRIGCGFHAGQNHLAGRVGLAERVVVHHREIVIAAEGRTRCPGPVATQKNLVAFAAEHVGGGRRRRCGLAGRPREGGSEVEPRGLVSLVTQGLLEHGSICRLGAVGGRGGGMEPHDPIGVGEGGGEMLPRLRGCDAGERRNRVGPHDVVGIAAGGGEVGDRIGRAFGGQRRDDPAAHIRMLDCQLPLPSLPRIRRQERGQAEPGRLGERPVGIVGKGGKQFLVDAGQRLERRGRDEAVGVGQPRGAAVLDCVEPK